MSDHGSPRYTPQTIGFDRNRADSSAVRADSASIFRGRQKESAQTLSPALPSQRLRRWRTVACGDPSRVTVGSPNSALRSEHQGGAPVNAGSAADRSDPDVDIVLKSYQAYARGDIDAAVSPLHPEVEWIEPDEFPNGGRHNGSAAATKYLRNSRAMWSDVTSETTPYRRGEKIIIVHHVAGRMIDGSTQDVTVADVYTIRDGQVVRMQAYAHPAEALAANP